MNEAGMVTNLAVCRDVLLRATYAAWNKTGYPLLALSNDGTILPLEQGHGGDAEIFYFVPYLARTFCLSLSDALWWWDTGVAASGGLIALAGFFFLTQTKVEKLVVLLGITGISLTAWMIGNLYLAPFFAFCFFPWVFVLLKNKSFKSLFCYWVLAGFVSAFMGSVRMYAGCALLIGGLLAVFLNTRKVWLTVVCSFCMLCGFGTYSFWFSSVMVQRNAYLDTQGISYGHYTLKHVFWHSIYIGLGFIRNDSGLYYADDCANKKAEEIQPGIAFNSPEYDQLLKHETIKVCKNQFQFVLRVLFAKCGVLLFYLFKFANVGLICAWFYRKPWFIEISYFFALCFNALPGLLTVPEAYYLVGFLTVATFYGVHSIVWALQHGLGSQLKHLPSNFAFLLKK
jgi:hypothetical protein